MKAFLAAIIKEALVLFRDRAGLGILFIMPLALIIIMALIQDGPYQNFQRSEFPLILVNHDKDTVGTVLEKNIREAKLFKVFKTINGIPATDETAKKAVSQGKFKAGIIIPAGLSKALNRNALIVVAKTFSEGAGGGKDLTVRTPDSVKIKYFLDPLTSFSFRNTISYILEKSASSLISQSITNKYYQRLENVHPVESRINVDSCRLIGIQEIDASDAHPSGVVFNSVQHNVPAWTLFAMFFIFLPLAGGIIRERDQGTLTRLKFMPHSFSTLISGKIMLYALVGCIQFLLMLLVGKFFLPVLGLSSLMIGNSFFSIMMVAFSASLAATGFGVLIGTFLSTQQQVVTFGSLSVIILSAIGGIWIPVYIMSKTMARISKLSPLEWGLNAFNEIFLHHGTFINVSADIIKLLLFSIVSFFLSFLYHQQQRIK